MYVAMSSLGFAFPMSARPFLHALLLGEKNANKKTSTFLLKKEYALFINFNLDIILENSQALN